MIKAFLGRLTKHEHSWRRMTARQDYGNRLSQYWGGYTGRKEEICDACGLTRYDGWKEWKYDLKEAEARVKYLMDTEPTK